MDLPADIEFSEIEKRVRDDAELVQSGQVAPQLIEKYTRDAYKAIADLRPELRIRENGAILARTLADAATGIPGEHAEFIVAYVAYVKWRIRSRFKMEASQAAAARSDWRDYMQALGFTIAEAQPVQ